MNIANLLSRVSHSQIPRLAIVTLIALACNTPAFCGETYDTAKPAEMTKVKALLKENPELVLGKDDYGSMPLHMTALSFAENSKQEKTRTADRPQFQYQVKGTVEELVKSEDLFRPFAAELRKYVESILRDYKIMAPGIKRDWLKVLAELDILDNRNDSARDRLAQIKALEEKPAAKALSGLVSNAILDARQEVADHSSQAYRQAISVALRRSLADLSNDLVQNELKQLKASVEIMSESLLLGTIRAGIDPIVEKTGSLSLDLASGLLNLRMRLLEIMPIRDTLVQTIDVYLSAHTKNKKDIWADRDVIFDPEKKYQAVNVAVWDSGVDLSIFKDKAAMDATGQPAVLAFDIEFRKTTGSLYPLNAEQSRKYVDAKKYIKGLMDLRANLDSPEAAELRQTFLKLKPEEVRSFSEEGRFYSSYAHGSHVAGILIAGNPYARVVTGRMTFDWKMIPDPCPSRELTDRSAAAFQDFVDFFKKNKVRVVNMSWGKSVKGLENGLEACAIGKDTQERKKTAREWFGIEKSALEKALSSAPDILFIASAGNSNRDVSMDEATPSNLRMKNLLTVGAVDRAGDETSFTSYGPTVVVQANGYEVESYIPGGDRVKGSGTSVASPNVANLAAKIIAVNPKLNPAQVIEIIRDTADKTADGRRNLINPKKAIEAALAP
jgi:subtilisin family serine protease